MRKYLIILLLCAGANVKAQNYKILADSGLHVMWRATDTIGERNALNLYEEAFRRYPNEIENRARYKASVLAGNLKELDKSFKYLGPVAKDGIPGIPGWRFIAGDYYESEYANLLKDARWTKLFEVATKQKEAYYKKLKDNENEFRSGAINPEAFKNYDGRGLYDAIRKYNKYTPKPMGNYSVPFKVTDSLSTSYYVSLPGKYDPAKRYPILFFLHGAVQNNGFSASQDESVLEGWNRYYTKYAKSGGVIMVYLQGSRKYNWMAPDDGFFMIPEVLKQIKKSINIDDDKVFITGHSNGATGSFSYLMKKQSPFAGFYGFNTNPKVRTGGTFIGNIANRSYINISTDEDYYFPPDANDSLNVIMKNRKADYQDMRFNGFPHWLPQFDESEPAYVKIFGDISKRSRKQFQQTLYWECDDVKYGKADWINITQLDTNANPAKWHQQVNFNIYKLMSYDKKENLITKDTLVKAFNFPRKSGTVKAHAEGNTFHLETSQVKSVTVYISPEMVDMSKPVVIYVNGIKKATKMPVYDKQLMLNNFEETLDRKAVWVDKIEIIL